MPSTIVDNASTQTQDNASTQQAAATQTAQTTTTTQTAAPTYTGWKSSLRSDLQGSPLAQKFGDDIDGLNKAFESHASLEKMLGHDKVLVPKGAEDKDGWNAFAKAMGVPDKADGYGLPDAALPESMAKQGLTLDKNQFAEVMHAYKVHPQAVKGIWEAYQKINIDSYNKFMEQHQENINKTINQLRSEWGDAYNTNVELGQTVINKFAPDKETNDWITATLSADPRGIKFLSKIGDQFAENKIPEFSMKKFSLAPSEAEAEVTKLKSDLSGPYWNRENKFTRQEQDAAIERVRSLQAVIEKHKADKR